MFSIPVDTVAVLQSPSCVQLFAISWTAAHQVPVPHHLLMFAQVHVHCISDAIQPSPDVLFSFCLQSFPASETFLMSQLFASDDQNTGASASATDLTITSQGWFPLGLTGLIFLQSKGLSNVFSSTTVRKHQFFGSQPYGPVLTSVHDYWKTIALTMQTFVGKVISLLFNMLSSFLIAFLSRSKRLLISWL